GNFDSRNIGRGGQRHFERGIIEREIIERGIIERGIIEREIIERGTIEREIIERGTIERESPRGKSSRGESSRGESSRGESLRMETRGRSVRLLFEHEEANHGVGKRKRPESWSINNTKKKLEFTGAPLGDKGVDELPGIGPIKARLFIAAGYSKAIQVFGKFLETDKDGFMKFLKDTGKMEGNNAGRLYDTLMEYKNQFLT
ncbi:Barrier-to-autointegration factor 1, partial [Gonioctena quinquepunctata]